MTKVALDWFQDCDYWSSLQS